MTGDKNTLVPPIQPMHILVVNDDGPPCQRISPYIRPFVDTLREAGHFVSVAVPAASRSWIGKAHLIEASLKATYVPPDAFRDDGTWSSSNVSNDSSKGSKSGNYPWAVVQNGTPASCVQLGLYNLFPDRPPVDLVISGPNHGRNASTIYNLSSGTVGGALEAATCGTRGIALSFGSKDEQPAETIRAAARLSVKVIEYLTRNWDKRVEVYNFNVPMRRDVETRPVRYTYSLPSYWSRGCLYAEITDAKTTPAAAENSGGSCSGASDANENGIVQLEERRFTWSADLLDLKKSLLAAESGTDAYSVLNGCTSVTPLRANLWHVPDLEGEIQLED